MDSSPNSKSPIPDSNQKIFLIGMPAAGKTYWGRKIAGEYSLSFIDLDSFISEQEKASVSALFAMYGEAGFREREHKYLKKLIANNKTCTVVACGGGTPCFNNNIQLMKDAGVVICLQADVPALMARLKDSEEVRPLLRGKPDLAAYLNELLNKRKGVYEQAHYILQSANISLTTFAEIISLCTNRQ